MLVPVYAILLALLVASVVILIVGGNPLEAYWALLRGMFGSADRIAASLGRSTPFIGAALAVAFAFRAGLFNIGAEGQLLVGATTAAWVGTFSLAGRRARPDRHPDHRPRRRPRRRDLRRHPRCAQGQDRRARGDRHDHAQQHRDPDRALAGELPGPADPPRRRRLGRPHEAAPRLGPAARADQHRPRPCTSGSSSPSASACVVWFVLTPHHLRLRGAHGRRQPERRQVRRAWASGARSSS